MSGNDEFGAFGAAELADFVGNVGETLVTLDLRGCNLGDNGLTWLCEAPSAFAQRLDSRRSVWDQTASATIRWKPWRRCFNTIAPRPPTPRFIHERHHWRGAFDFTDAWSSAPRPVARGLSSEEIHRRRRRRRHHRHHRFRRRRHRIPRPRIPRSHPLRPRVAAPRARRGARVPRAPPPPPASFSPSPSPDATPSSKTSHTIPSTISPLDFFARRPCPFESSRERLARRVLAPRGRAVGPIVLQSSRRRRCVPSGRFARDSRRYERVFPTLHPLLFPRLPWVVETSFGRSRRRSSGRRPTAGEHHSCIDDRYFPTRAR